MCEHVVGDNVDEAVPNPQLGDERLVERVDRTEHGRHLLPRASDPHIVEIAAHRRRRPRHRRARVSTR